MRIIRSLETGLESIVNSDVPTGTKAGNTVVYTGADSSTIVLRNDGIYHEFDADGGERVLFKAKV